MRSQEGDMRCWPNHYGHIGHLNIELSRLLLSSWCNQKAVLPVELNLQVNRVASQDILSSEEYRDRMMDEVDDLSEKCFEALREIERDKVRTAGAYNKKV
jgi:hypothetical protein